MLIPQRRGRFKIPEKNVLLCSTWMPMPMPEADAPTVAVEVPEADEKSKTISMARVAEYLPQRFVGKTGNKKAPDDLRSCAISLVTGRFLVLTDNILTEDKGVSSAARESLDIRISWHWIDVKHVRYIVWNPCYT